MLSNGQFEVHENETSKSELILSLTIRNVTIRNMGKYECVAKNPFGAAEANIRAYSKSRAGVAKPLPGGKKVPAKTFSSAL